MIFSISINQADKSSLQPAERVIYQGEFARHIQLELNHGRATGWDGHRLHIRKRGRRERSEGIDPVEDLADQMEGRGQVRPPSPK